MTLNVLFKNEQIHSLIPQRKPMVMVDTFFEGSDTHAITGLTVRADNLFCLEGIFTESGLIEHIAQSASAMAGYTAFCKQEQAPVGYIGEVKKFRLFRCPHVGETLQTTVQLISEVIKVSLVAAETKSGDETVASCQMKIFINKE
ncbi:MAG: hydroxymyristoyl-ACP dehydratase [Tannerella sp.]|jgi:predicted hotdog family 3-hydroxylacyl-ACP dehydratase|nr:hydroxymyristoyl-ACP dehydratase [Tannerella sp.]